MMWHHGWGYGGWWGGAFGIFLTTVFAAAVVVAVIFLVRALASQPPRSAAWSGPTPTETLRESPEDILKRRYASGEIEREEYLQKLKDLKGRR